MRIPWLCTLAVILAASAMAAVPGSLRDAVRSGDLAAVKALLDAGADVNERDQLGATPLLDAAWYGNEQIVRLLVEGGARVDATHDEGGSTPLDYAVLRGNEAIVHLLLERGAKSKKALHTAAGHGRTEIVRLLIASGMPVDARDDAGFTPLDLAALQGNGETVDSLLVGGARVDVANPGSGATPLGEAAAKGNATGVAALLRAGADPARKDSDGLTPFENAVSGGHLEAARLLLERFPVASGRLSGLLRDAAGRGDAPMVRLLAVRGADPKAGSVLAVAARKGLLQVVKALLELKVPVEQADATGATPLYNAVVGGQVAMVSLLLEHGALVNAREPESGNSALYAACSLGSSEVAIILLDHRADPNLANKTGHRAVYAAASNGYSELAAEVGRRGGR